MFTWKRGANLISQSGIYGKMGEENPENNPGSRTDAAGWVDPDGNLWLFGGSGIDKSGEKGHLNDLWKYNIMTGNWVWESGSDKVQTLGGVYGTAGTGTGSTFPGARWGAKSWIDSNANLWLFGGWGIDSHDEEGHLNDLWKYETATGNWIWMGGSNRHDDPGIMGAQGIASTTNFPGPSMEELSWNTSSGVFWLFGGGANYLGNMIPIIIPGHGG